ncbi:MAG: aminoglycoside phosphotransferase family protein [Candidatus Pacebacteria bacterium]|nr:aminoglycoside phosphotransferase family protein [Candidatus Paceibacterota bacterium]
MNKRELLQKIRKEFPELVWTKAEHNVDGQDHYVIILDNKFVFRFPRTTKYLKRLQNEILLLKYLKNKLNVSIPEYIYVAKDKSFAGYVLIPGFQLKKKVFRDLSRETKISIAKRLAEFLSILHKTPLRVASTYGIKEPEVRTKYSNLKYKINKYVTPRLSKKENVWVQEYLKDLKKYFKFPKEVFTHNDLYSRHLLLDKNTENLTGIIDFSDRKIGDPARDFGELWDYGREFVFEVYKNYKGPKDKDFIKRSVLYYQRSPFWEMISRFEGGRGSFRSGHKMFRWRFLHNNIEI